MTNPNANGVHKKEVMRKNPIFALKICSRVVHVTNFLMLCWVRLLLLLKFLTGHMRWRRRTSPRHDPVVNLLDASQLLFFPVLPHQLAIVGHRPDLFSALNSTLFNVHLAISPEWKSVACCGKSSPSSEVSPPKPGDVLWWKPFLIFTFRRVTTKHHGILRKLLPYYVCLNHLGRQQVGLNRENWENVS